MLPYRSPHDPELRTKWAKNLNKDANEFYTLCHLHFREEDILYKRTRIMLKKGTTPIPIVTIKTEMLVPEFVVCKHCFIILNFIIFLNSSEESIGENSERDNIKVVDIDVIKRFDFLNHFWSISHTVCNY